jgi:glucokinase
LLGHDVGGLASPARRRTRHGHLFVAIGTGIAAAHVVDGSAAVGAHGAAGEIGHILVRPDGPRCGCGRTGCLEAVASAAAIARRYAELAGGPATAAEVVERAAAGEELAGRVWREAVEALGRAGAVSLRRADRGTGGGLAQAGACSTRCARRFDR